MKRAVLPIFLLLAGCGRKTPGQIVYGPHCGICHHGGGGMPGEIPPLVGRVDIFSQTPEGRHYLADVLLDGVQGPFTTQGYRYNFSMSAFRDQLDDQQIADVLNWLIMRGDTQPAHQITSAEVAAARTHHGNPQATYQERQALERLHSLP